ncbi:MAG: hypothetical protein EZS28_032862 [Streblomastix strix]|uniref:Uncharacterized protein n=1 Tax=Streblomastix strix TaxID=222440 RepID=A0A5J4UNJ1_9EUKA|nr:MAG: hypothetical protein EZS28_032862 [Streblomastix strix]
MLIYDAKQLNLTILKFLIIAVEPLRRFFASNHWNICKVLVHCNTQEPFEFANHLANQLINQSQQAAQSSPATVSQAMQLVLHLTPINLKSLSHALNPTPMMTFVILPIIGVELLRQFFVSNHWKM